MSWKSIVSAGLLCLLASPVLAAAPTLRVVNGPALEAGTGNWVWNVSIETAIADSPVAAELGFDANRAIVGTPALGALFDGTNTVNPGEVIFGWETLTGTPAAPEGVQVGVGAGAEEQVFSALGSEANLPNSPTQSAYLTIITTGPTNTNLTGSLQVLGAYGAGTDEGRIAQYDDVGAAGDCAADTCNYRAFTGTATRTLQNGDINLDTFADDTDFGIFAGQYQPAVAKAGGWTVGDFNRDGFVDDTDFGIFAGAYAPGVGGGSTTNLTAVGVVDPAPGAGAGLGGGAVPEPASIALVGLAILGGLGLARRKR